MPLRIKAKSLQEQCMIAIVQNWNKICYFIDTNQQMFELLETDKFLDYKGPFTDYPTEILEGLLKTAQRRSSLSRRFLHLLLQEQLQQLNLSFGVGEIYYGLKFLPRCKKLRQLQLSYLTDVDPRQLTCLIPNFLCLTHLDLQMTCTVDEVNKYSSITLTIFEMLELIAEYCENLQELILTSTFVSDPGIRALCGLNRCDKKKCCQRLRKLLLTETRVTWLGAIVAVENFPYLMYFDFEKIFKAFEYLDPEFITKEGDDKKIPTRNLRTLYSVAHDIRIESIEAAAHLCPHVEKLSIMNAWLNEETFFKFMLFTNLKDLTVCNNEGLTLDFYESLLPLIQVLGEGLHSLSLSKFCAMDIISIGRCCKNLRNLSLSSIFRFETTEKGILPGIFEKLLKLQLWLNDETQFSCENIVKQLLVNATSIQSILIKRCQSLNLELMNNIWEVNEMKELERITFESCDDLELETLKRLLFMENELSALRIWCCPNIQRSDYTILRKLSENEQYDLYIEWFE